MCTLVTRQGLSVDSGTRSVLTKTPVQLRLLRPASTACRRRLTAVETCSQEEKLDTRRQVLLQAVALSLGGTALTRPAAATTECGECAHQNASKEILCIAETQLPQTVATQYDSYAAGYDQLDTGAAAEAFGIPDLRRSLLSKASGQVLEVAVGTGINLPLYNRQQVHSLVGIDISEGMLQQARSKGSGGGAGLQLTLQQGDVEALPFEKDSFDCVVDTFSLCVFPKPLLALQQMAAVLRPSGKLLLLEHSRSKLPILGLYQDVTAGAVAALGKGCVWNQDVTGLLRQAGLRPTRLQTTLGGLITLVEAEKMTC